MAPVKMIAIDLDDTLLHDDISLSDYTKDILRKVMERNIRIVIATGRMFQAARPWGQAIGLGDGARMSVVAKRLNITVGSLTTSMNSLVNKGYVARARSEKDRRVVNVYLLEKGIAAYKHHEEFHEKMLDAIMETLSSEELVVWAKSCDRLTQFLKSYDKSHIKKAK